MNRDERVAARPSTPRPDFDVEERIVAVHDGVYFLDKPAGWPTSGRTLEDPECLQYHLMQHTQRKIWAVHQLDADTSGLNVFTHRRSSVGYWQKRLHFPSAQKEYLALAHGRIDAFMRITSPIGRRADATWGVSPDGRSATTYVIPVVATDDFSLVRVQLRTGRTHQIRVHLGERGHPLVGEFWYNDAPCLLADRHMLHAWRTQFDKRDAFECGLVQLPEDFIACAKAIGIEIPDVVDGDSTSKSELRRRSSDESS